MADKTTGNEITKDEIRWIFIREFTKHLINNSISDEERKMVLDQDRKTEGWMPEPIITQGMLASPKVLMPPRQIPVQRAFPKIAPLPGNMDLGKLNLFLGDPRVNQLECYGPKKEILVKVNGQTQKTSISLKKEEIEEVINSFSEKTRIPLIKGVFRAALGNLILTAVTSDFVDTRFTIQKRAPFEKLND